MSSAPPRPETETDRLQRLASDPALSAWVSANAGSGKTEVLVRRVMRLMLDKVKPDEILCLTYTKAAAAEMTNRVFERLGGWITLDDAALSQRIVDLTGRAPDRDTMQRARRLFADALETPGGLKIQTIHAFCERLLHLFPFDANAPAHFEVLDEAAQAEMINHAIAAIIAGRAEGGADAAKAFARVAEDAPDKDFRDLLMKMLDARARGRDSDVAAIRAREIARLAATLGVDENERADDATASYGANAFGPDVCAMIAAAYASAPGANNAARAAVIARIAESSDLNLRLDLARALFLTAQKDQRSPTTLMTAKARQANPLAAAAIDAEATRFAALLDRLAAIDALDRNRAMFMVVDATLAHYQAAKARRGALDFADLIEKTRALLANPGIGPWILYKLDSRLSHILVDEAQDTSDAQWDIIRRLAEEFTAGEGARQTRRTVFAVGDEKQSIYGFQGAAPQSFAATREYFHHAHAAADRSFESVQLKVSFRSTREVLSAVDRIFAGAQRSRGLSFDAGGAAPHESNRIDKNDIGFVELWPLITKVGGPESDDYLDPDGAIAAVDTPDAESPAMRLARRVADNCRLLIENGDPCGRAVRPGDIMILVRRRNALFEAIIAALKQIGVPVAGSDRLKVAQHIAVRDCLALARAALAPDDDYALACALKSPLIGLDDDDLIAFAPQRQDRLIDALRRAAATNEGIARAAEFVARWRDRAALGPFGFFGLLLEAEGGRRKLLQRLGAEAGDALDEFLARALDFERRDGASLAAFAAAFEDSDLDIKRDLDQAANEVRVMTVHAAKGLEAPIVILPDTTGRPEGRGPASVVKLATGRSETPLAIWAASGATPPAVKAARDAAASEAADEHRRLLYVALTRARNGLVIAGAIGRDRAPDGSWYAQVSDALEEGDVATNSKLASTPARDGQEDVRYWRLLDREPSAQPGGARATPIRPPTTTPVWALERASREQPSTPPLSPSRAFEAADRPERAVDRPEAAEARIRGRFVHRLLEALPNLPAEARAGAAEALAARTTGLAPDEAQALIASTAAILEDRRFAALFSPRSRGEVSIAGPVRRPGGLIRVSGTIDRLALTGDEILIGDYKTGLRPPASPAQTPRRITAQLALYRALVAPLYPGRRVRCVVIWTAGPIAHELPDAMLDEAFAAIAGESAPDHAAF